MASSVMEKLAKIRRTPGDSKRIGRGQQIKTVPARPRRDTPSLKPLLAGLSLIWVLVAAGSLSVWMIKSTSGTSAAAPSQATTTLPAHDSAPPPTSSSRLRAAQSIPDLAFAPGDDPDLDRLWRECEAGDGEACDELFETAPLGSEYERFGLTCGGRNYAATCNEIEP